MALQHDEYGFLVGDPIDLGKVPNYLLDIKRDVLAIKNAAIKPASSTRAQSTVSAAVTNNSGRFAPKNQSIATPTGSRRAEAGVKALAESIGLSDGKQKQAVERMRSASRKSTSTVVNGRDASGRFVGGDGSSSGSSSNSAVSILAAKLSRLSGIGSGLEEVDPSIRAFQEVAEPMKRGIEFFGGSGDRQNSWLKKIFKSLNVFHKEDTIYSKSAKKSLKAIEEKQSYSSSQSSSGLGGIGRLLAGLGGKKALMMLLKKTPVLGSILGMLGIGADVEGIEGDDTLSRREKNKAIGSDVGGFGGTIAGMMAGGKAGAALGSFLGPAGTAIGSVIGAGIGMLMGDKFGQVVGSTFGDWVSDLSDADIPGKIVGAWNVAVEKITAIFGDIKGMASKAFDGAKEQLNDANNYVKKSTGVDLKDLGGKWWERTKANVSGAIGGVKAGVDWVSKDSTIGKAISGISGLSSSQADSYAADVRRTESSGNYRAENKQGFIGAYQMGADTLADTGLVNLARLKAAKKSGKFDQKSFLADSENWTIGGGKDAFFNNPELQDKAFADMQKRNLSAGLKAGAISKKSSPQQVAAYLKVAHLGGAGGANNFFLNGKDRSDGRTWLSQYAKQGAASVSAPAFKSPSMPVMPGYADTPAITQPLGSPDKPSFTVNMPAQDVGQNVSDRGIAHIVSGGIGRRFN